MDGGILGFLGMAVGFIALGLLIRLRRDFETLKKKLEDSGTLRGD